MEKTVAIIGLGYVGLPLAVLSAKKGYTTIGLERTEKKAKEITDGKNTIEDEYVSENLTPGMIQTSTDPSTLKQADIILVCVPTPVDKEFNPDLGPVRNAVETIAKNLKKGALVVIESTINPGVCEEVVEPIFASHGLTVNKDYHLAHCPERINPGDPNWDVRNIPRVVGSLGDEGLKIAVEFYENILEGTVRPMKSIREAEATKIMENSFRDINIAFVNELAKSFDRMGIDILDVIGGAATKPFAFMPHYPSCGVGGHCIPVDPYYLIERAKKSGFDHKFLRAARTINNSMPSYTVELLQDALNERKMPLNGTKVGVLGIAYKAGVNDIRESPALKIIEELKKHKAEVLTFDPYILKQSTEKSLEEILEKSEALILVTNHKEFLEITADTLKKNDIQAIIDGKNCLEKESIKQSGILYHGIGR